MTVISDTLKNVAKTPATSQVWFSASLRQGMSGGIIVDKWHKVTPNSAGLFTTPDLDPGPAVVRFPGTLNGDLDIVIPTTGTAIPLWPLISAAINIAPDTSAERLATAIEDYFDANPPSGGGGGSTITEDPSRPGVFIVASGGNVTEDPTRPGVFLIGA